jgi:hypothetical protein
MFLLLPFLYTAYTQSDVALNIYKKKKFKTLKTSMRKNWSFGYGRRMREGGRTDLSRRFLLLLSATGYGRIINMRERERERRNLTAGEECVREREREREREKEGFNNFGFFF